MGAGGRGGGCWFNREVALPLPGGCGWPCPGWGQPGPPAASWMHFPVASFSLSLPVSFSSLFCQTIVIFSLPHLPNQDV